MKLGNKTLTIILLIIALILVNYLAMQIPARIDVTAEKIYTLSPGTKTLLSKINEPITLNLYFSKNTPGLPVFYKNYEERVLEMLHQYIRTSHGKISLHVINPEADTPDEEKATQAGIQAERIQQGGEAFYFGLVAIQADQQKVIASFNPEREQFLEYDLSQLLSNVQKIDKLKLGLITSLPLQGEAGNPMLGQSGSEGQYVYQEWQDTFNIQSIDATATELPGSLDALAIIHPENLTPKLQFEIDQFLLKGKPVFIAVDPSSQYFKRMGGEQAMMNPGGLPNVSSDLPTLFKGWGINYDPQKIVGDNIMATQVSLRNGSTASYPVWLSATAENTNKKALPSAQLSSMIFIESGSIDLTKNSKLSFTPLIQTSSQAGLLDSSYLAFAQPEDIAKKITPSGTKTIAALISGKFNTAFPEGKPEDKNAKFIKESTTNSNLIIVADTDWLFDDFSVVKANLLGTTQVEPRNDNLYFASNALEFLSGSQDLISIRGKGNSLHPFTVVQHMQAEAAAKYREQLGVLENKISEVESRLTELQGKQTDKSRLVASPEVTKAVEDFQKQSAALRSERRTIRLQLRKGIDSLGNYLLAFNLIFSPALVCCFGYWFQRSRKK
jgi:ABC-type uncharacterized transport system involved in gliding motility auxiliary subunit